jgi:hypothetical protein
VKKGLVKTTVYYFYVSNFVCIVGEVFEEEKENQEVMSRNCWWSEFVKPEDLEVLANSNKLVLLFSILKECEAIGDKV